VTAPFRFPRFFVTTPAPCPYLPGRQERKVFTELTGPHATELNDALGRIGFRRSQGVAYRPSCAGCAACVSVRVVTHDFSANATQRKLLRRNEDLEVTACRPWATDEQFQLLRRYLAARHPGGGMAGMDEDDYADMVEHSPVNSLIIEYRTRSTNGERGRLVGACLTDRQADGLSMIYSFFAPDDDVTAGTTGCARPGLGNVIIMDHITRARDAGLSYVYLGYWVKGSARMAYKTRYRPLEVLGPNGWRPFDDGELAAEPQVAIRRTDLVTA
jgi:arginyl-tRNA--protein-N-Asp/Glu arginylyltransferase